MFITRQKSLALLALAGCSAVCQADPPAIGFARATGQFKVDQARVVGNATLFSGSMVETERASSVLQLTGGARLTLGASSQTKIYSDHAELERGVAQVANGKPYEMHAAGLRVASSSGPGATSVEMSGAGKVRVSAGSGEVQVRSHSGALVARITPGTALEFGPGAGASQKVEMAGLLTHPAGRWMITDQLTHVTAELQGLDDASLEGQPVEISGEEATGAKPAREADKVVKVRHVSRSSHHTAHSLMSKPVMIGGVAVASAAAVTTTAVVLSEDSKQTISR